MKYKVGDHVRIKNIDWYNENKDINGNVHCGDKVFDNYMSVFCGSIVTIGGVYPYNAYNIREDMHCRAWTDEMIEGHYEEENIDCEKCGLTRNSTRCLFMDNCPHNKQKNIIEIPKDWVLKDENGNVINATKIVLEKKKKEVTYPKTYEECCKVLGVDPDNFLSIRNLYRDDGEEETTDYERDLLGKFDSLWELKICRDAYWKIAGEEMGLGKPWEPDYDSGVNKYGIICINGVVQESNPTTNWERHLNKVLDFPTEEMRDAFHDNFKELIEIVKELL